MHDPDGNSTSNSRERQNPADLRDWRLNRRDKIMKSENQTEGQPQVGSDAGLGGWVRCADRLPKSRQLVLVAIEAKVVRLSCLGGWDGDEWCQAPDSSQPGNGYIPSNLVTHWMPLPAPPNAFDVATKPAPDGSEKHK